MYSTCLFCTRPLGGNEIVEHFPVGSRLAFDGAKGRLWVICRACGRWNLTPLEERWEAIEECEHLFERTRLRLSTDHIGLARLTSGLELVRIGHPQRPEFAAWRYGDTFGRRRRRNIIRAGAAVGAMGAVMVGGSVAGLSLGGVGWMWWRWIQRAVHGSPNKIVARVPSPDGTFDVRRKHLRHVRLDTTGAGDWSLAVPIGQRRLYHLSGREATRTVARLMPHMNPYAGAKSQIQQAVGLLETAPSPDSYLASAARGGWSGSARKIVELPRPAQLALEMAANEESERRALEGELWFLEHEWRQAEEIAAIADNLLVPSATEAFLRRHRPPSRSGDHDPFAE